MKKILKLLGFYKVDDYIDIIVLAGKTRYSKDKLDFKINRYVVLPIILVILILSLSLIGLIVSINDKDFGFFQFLYSLVIFTPSAYVIINLNNIFQSEIIIKFIKSEFIKKTRKKFNIDIKDKDFIVFIDDSYSDILKMNLSKKETILFVNNWKENVKKLSLIRIENVKKELKKGDKR